MKSKGKKRKKT